jgi:hypothetical protein
MSEQPAAPSPRFDTSKTISRTLTAIAEGITGIASSERKDWILSFGHLLQRLRGSDLLATFINEWNAYREKGKIREDYTQSDQHKDCLQELLDFLDQGSPDAARFAVLKKILLVAATESASNRASVLPQQYMRLCRNLTSGELLVLLTAHEVSKAPPSVKLDTPESAILWLETIARVSGLHHPELVEIHERALIEKNLITPRLYPDRSGVSMGSHFRLTQLAHELCAFVACYEEPPAA